MKWRIAFAWIVAFSLAGRLTAQAPAIRTGASHVAATASVGVVPVDANGNPLPLDVTIEYPLTAEQGPVMIFIASYPNKAGLTYANRLARELRRLRFEAYVMDHTEKVDAYQPSPEQIKEWKKQFLGRAPAFGRLNTPPVPHYAVLVGNFKAIEAGKDRSLDATLKQLRRLSPKSFAREVAVELQWGNEFNGKPLGQMVGMRAVYNTLRPREQPRLDASTIKTLKMLKEMNEQERYTIYQLNAPVTIRVYTFSGNNSVVIADKQVRQKSMNGMEIAGRNAVVLCDVMRQMDYEAYVFHGQTASCVCVGGYPSQDDPRLAADFQKFAQMKISELQLDPSVMPVPRRPDEVLSAN